MSTSAPTPGPSKEGGVPSQQSTNSTTHPLSPTLNNMCWPEFPALQDEFSTLVSKLSETVHKLEQLQYDSLLVYLRERLRPMVDGCFPTEGSPNLPKGITASELVPHLQDYNYWNYLNTDLVEGIIKRVSGVGSPLASLMAEYKENVRSKVTHTLEECKTKNVNPEPPPHYTTIVVEINNRESHPSVHLHRILQVEHLLVQNFGVSGTLFREVKTEMVAGPIFTGKDVRRVLAEERGDGEQGGWSLANQSDNVEVWRKTEKGVSSLKARVCARVCVCLCCLFVHACIIFNFPIKYAFNNAAQSLLCPVEPSHTSCTATCCTQTCRVCLHYMLCPRKNSLDIKLHTD